jgi:hypothetical protein
MPRLTADKGPSAVSAEPNQHVRAGLFTRFCLPLVLWTIVGIAAPAFVADLYHSRRDIQEDFAVYYLLGHELRQGIDPYATDFAAAARQSGFNIHVIRHGSEPPTFIALVCVPLSRLPIRSAYWLWQAINVGCLIAAIYMLIGPGCEIAPRTIVSLVALTVLYPPVVTHIWMGQSKLPALLLLVLAMRWMQRGRDRRAGFTLALASLLRVFPFALGGYLILQQRWRILFYTAIGLTIGGAVTVAIVGIHNCISFVTAAARLVDQTWTDTPRDISIDTFVSRQLHAANFLSANVVADIALLLNISTKLVILSATAKASLSQPAAHDPDSRIYSLWVVTSIFLLPVVWDYDLTLLLIPFGILVLTACRGEASRRAIAAGVISYILSVFWDYLTPVRYECGFFSMVAAYLSAYWLAIDEPAAIILPVGSMPGEIWRRLSA